MSSRRATASVVGSTRRRRTAQQPLDLGATWFWPHERRVRQLVGELGVDHFAETPVGDAMYQVPGGVQRLDGNPLDTSSFRFALGADSLARALAGQLRNGHRPPQRAGVGGVDDVRSSGSAHACTRARRIARRDRATAGAGDRLRPFHTWPAGAARRGGSVDAGVDGRHDQGGRPLSVTLLARAGPLRIGDQPCRSDPRVARHERARWCPAGALRLRSRRERHQYGRCRRGRGSAGRDLRIGGGGTRARRHPGLAHRAVDVTSRCRRTGRLPDVRPRGVFGAVVGRPFALVLDRDGSGCPRPHRGRTRGGRTLPSGASCCAVDDVRSTW